MELNKIICGKSQDKLKEIPDNYFDGVVTDPPYEMGFMGKAWDASGIAYSVELWKEVLRVSKPGSHLLCFGGTRTHHRVACAIEDAGWIIRDEIDWIYGEGFPKSTNISKQLDKEAGAEREQIWYTKTHVATSDDLGSIRSSRPHIDEMRKNGGRFTDSNEPATDDAKRWEGYGTALKPAHEPIIVAMKPLENGLTYAANAKKWNVAGLNIDGCRIAGAIDPHNYTADRPCETKGGWGFKGSKGTEPHSQGRFPSNVILSHSPDCVCVGTKQIGQGEYKVNITKDAKPSWKNSSKDISKISYGQETIEVYACVPDCPIRIMDSQSGQMKSGEGSGLTTTKARSNMNASIDGINRVGYNDSGGASRFFYCAKAKRSEKEHGLREFAECVKCGKFNSKTHTINGIKENCTRNNHPTVKPVSLMEYLLTLIKMPNENQIILDPFCGSGSTLIAAEHLGINYIGIDQDFDSVLISTARIG